MSVGYSSDERDAAVSGLVQGTLSFPVDRLGVRNQATPFEEVRELANSALLYDPDAVFFIINQAAKALGNTVSTEVQTCNDLLDAVDDLSMPDKPIEDVGSLSDAATSLSIMQGALARRGVIGASEYGRYNAAIDRAAKEIGRTAKMTYVPRGGTQVIKDVVRSSSEAKSEVLSQFKSLKEIHDDLISRIGYILSAYEQFLSANLSGVVGQRQLSRAASEMRALHEELDPKTPMERTATARGSLLKVLANKSIVKALKTRVMPGEARVEQVSGAPVQYRLSPAGTGTPSELTGTISAPWAIQATVADRLQGDYNGTSVNVDLVDGSTSGIAGIQQAQVDGITDGDFAVHSDIATPYRLVSNVEPFNVTANPYTPGFGVFQIVVDGTQYECQITAGAARTAAQIRADLINPAMWISPPGQAPLTVTAAGGVITIAYNNGSPPASYSEREMAVVSGYLAITQLWPWSVEVPGVGLVAGERSFGWNANNELWIHPNDYDDFTSTPIIATLPNGSFPGFLITTAQAKTAIDNAATASSEEFAGIEITDGTTGKKRIGVVSTWQRLVNGSAVSGGEGSQVTIRSAGLRTSGSRIGLGTPSYMGMRTLGFYEGQDSREGDISGQAVVKALNQNTNFKAQAKASLVKKSYFESTEGFWNYGGILLKVQETDPTTDWPPASELKVSIRSGGNKGIYGLSAYDWVNIFGLDFLALTLDRRMRSEEPSIRQSFEIYSEHLKLASLVDTATSEIDLNDPAGTARLVLGLSTVPVYGTVSKMLVEWNDPSTGWKPFDARSRKIKVGDKVVDGSGSEVSSVAAVSELEDGLVGVSPEVPGETSYSAFAIVSADYQAYRTFIVALETWWAGFAYQEDLNALDRAINTVLRSHPNKDRVDAVYAVVTSLRDALTGTGSLEELIQAFSVRNAPAASAATRTFGDRGLDRARELLLQGRFEEFFGTTSRTSSHGSAFLDAAAKAVVQDLNENNAAKTRFSAVYRRKVGDWDEDVDPSVDFSDVEEDLPDDDLEENWPGIDEDIYGEH